MDYRAIQMARAYPHASIIGVDLAPCSLHADLEPDNFHFELDNVDLGLSHYFDQFDVVHARGIGVGVRFELLPWAISLTSLSSQIIVKSWRKRCFA